MYFVSRGGRLYAFCVQLSSWQRYMLTISVVGSLVCGWYYLVYMPLEDVIASYDHRYAHARHTYTTAQTVQSKIEDLKKQVHRLQGQLQTTFVLQQEAVSPVGMLTGYARQAGLILHSCSCEGSQNKTWYNEVSLLLDATGSPHQLLTFFDILSKSQRIYGCSSVNIARQEKQFHVRGVFSEYSAIDQKEPFNLRKAEGLGG